MKLTEKEKLKFVIAFMILIGTIFFIGLQMVSAEVIQEQYPVNIPVNLQFTCTLNNAIPSSSATLNLSIYYQNGNTLIENKKATSLRPGSFNYTVTFISNEVYKVKIFCTDGTYSYSNEGSYLITQTGNTLNTVQISIYIFFLLLCLVLVFFSIGLFKKNKFSKDVAKGKDLYEMKKRNEFTYYMTVLKKHFWIVGVFGVYLGLLVFFAILDQLVYDLGLNNLNNVIKYIVIGFSWGLIPFILFWFVWLIIVFYKSSTDILKYQFGSFRSEK